ncbi:DUF5710 domain-containing protein [Massilia soli]|uniref:DUF5710 domain-containing protein n=1 Tax=Massilia soli TaxID=2792854 RepID=A0ABS7SRE7_9BURK|nr:DUF5710 domain-containing protein [Massilia soli]MBZ2208510.1 DUF5710 domain-containing protein [Massilia soli]
MILLNVPYAEKDAARALGAKWDAGKKKWYVPAGVLATPFAKWIDGTDKLPQETAKRSDSSAGKIVVGANYKPVEGAVGLPWDD